MFSPQLWLVTATVNLASFFFIFLYTVVLIAAATHVESRTSGSFHWYTYYPFVFGDSFADTGNLAKSNLSRDSRQWYSPYGISRLSGRPTGRFSDGFVQSGLLGNQIKSNPSQLASSHALSIKSIAT